MNAGRTTTLVRLIDISVASSSQVWAVDTSNTPLRLTNAGWAPFRGGGVGLLEKISAGADGTVMGVDSAGRPWRLTPGTSEWRMLAGQVTQISTGGAGRIAAVNSAGSVFTLSFDTWRQMTGALSKVSITSRGKIYGVNSVGEFWAYDGSSWRNLGHPLKEVSATENAVWGIDSRGTIELSGTPPTPPTPNPPLMAGLFESPAQATFSNIAPLPNGGWLKGISAANDGTVWGIDGGGQPQYWTGTTWVAGPVIPKMSGIARLASLSVGSASQVWAVTEDGRPYQLTTVGWGFVPGMGSPVSSISAAADGTVVALDSGGHLYSFQPATFKWVALSGVAAQISAGNAARILSVDSGGSVFFLDGIAGKPLPGTLSTVSATASGFAYGLNSAGTLFAYNPNSWIDLGHPLSQVSATDYAIWGIDRNRTIQMAGGPPTPPALNPPAPASGTTNAQPAFLTMAPLPNGGRLNKISAANDGSVWGVDSAGVAQRWTGRTWEAYAMNMAGSTSLVQLSDISVGSASHVWGVASGSGYPFHLTATGWEKLPGVFTQISAAADGTVVGVDASGRPSQFNPATRVWGVLPGACRKISAGSAGTIKCLDSAGSVSTLINGLWGVPRQGTLTQVSATASDNVYGLGGASRNSLCVFGGRVWRDLGHEMNEVTATDNAIWGIGSSGVIEMAGAPPAPPTLALPPAK